MCFDFSKLSGRITEFFGTQYQFAVAIGLSEKSLSNKLNHRVFWKSDEIARACKVLNINKNEIHEYFFKEKVQ